MRPPMAGHRQNDAIRILGPGDEAALDGFLATRTETSLFLRSNLRRAGIVDGGRTYQATYAAWIEGGAVTAVAAHCWNGMVALQAPHSGSLLTRAAAAACGRPITGLLGPYEQASEVRKELGLDRDEASRDSREDLFTLPLDRIKVPAALARGELEIRGPRPSDLEELLGWYRDYRTETMGGRDDPELIRSAREQMERNVAEGVLFIATRDGALVSMAGWNARLPDTVQIGGVWTPVALRGRGYARAAVAGALLAAQRDGARLGVLFTDQANHAARRAYEAIGFERIGDYALILFRHPRTVGQDVT
jgi:RimJ/RimL family protein N-acetyltransferase